MIAAIDFTTVEVWTKGGLTTFYLLFAMELKTSRVKSAGCTTNPNEVSMKTLAIELTNYEDGFLKEKKVLIMDRNAKSRACLRHSLSHRTESSGFWQRLNRPGGETA